MDNNQSINSMYPPQNNSNQQQVNSANSQVANSQPQVQALPKAKSNYGSIITVAVLSVMVVAGGLVGGYYYAGNMPDSVPLVNNTVLGAFSQNSYYAIFMNGGQVYFGKITDKNEHELQLTDVHFLQVDGPSSQAAPSADSADQLDDNISNQPNLSIVKRTNTLHSPTGDITVNMDNVSFYEELSPESQVLEAINASNEENN